MGSVVEGDMSKALAYIISTAIVGEWRKQRESEREKKGERDLNLSIVVCQVPVIS